MATNEPIKSSMKSPNGTTVPTLPMWMNTIHNDTRRFGHIIDISQYAAIIGYPFICWNDRVYYCWSMTDDGEDIMATDTGWERSDVDYHTVHSPQLDHYINFTNASW